LTDALVNILSSSVNSAVFEGNVVFMNKTIDKSIKKNALKFRMDKVTLRLLAQARGDVAIGRGEFIRLSIREKAEAIISGQDRTRFSTEDWQMFFAMLDNPPEPTERTKTIPEAAAYNEWLVKEVQASIDDPRPNMTHEQVIAQVQAVIDKANAGDVHD
jgi:uncharacterized protein (DUF1778 family)